MTPAAALHAPAQRESNLRAGRRQMNKYLTTEYTKPNEKKCDVIDACDITMSLGRGVEGVDDDGTDGKRWAVRANYSVTNQLLE